jgi:hypothetical protein
MTAAPTMIVVLHCGRVGDLGADGLGDRLGARVARIGAVTTKRTASVLAALAVAQPARFALPPNHGRGGLVRQGLLHAVDHGATPVGCSDVRASTPSVETARLLAPARPPAPLRDVFRGVLRPAAHRHRRHRLMTSPPVGLRDEERRFGPCDIAKPGRQDAKAMHHG